MVLLLVSPEQRAGNKSSDCDPHLTQKKLAEIENSFSAHCVSSGNAQIILWPDLVALEIKHDATGPGKKQLYSPTN